MNTIEKLKNLGINEKLIYHTGFLARDISFYDEIDGLLEVKNAAWDLYEKGAVTLVQRYAGLSKSGANIFEYIAIGRR